MTLSSFVLLLEQKGLYTWNNQHLLKGRHYDVEDALVDEIRTHHIIIINNLNHRITIAGAVCVGGFEEASSLSFYYRIF
jgi:hypothetical protein